MSVSHKDTQKLFMMLKNKYSGKPQLITAIMEAAIIEDNAGRVDISSLTTDEMRALVKKIADEMNPAGAKASLPELTGKQARASQRDKRQSTWHNGR